MQDFKNEFNNLNPSELEKNRIYNKITSQRETSKKFNKFLKPALTFALVIGISASAYAFSSNQNRFTNEVINYTNESFAQNTNISALYKNNKLTCESVFGTEQSVFMLLSMENTRGKKINKSENDLKNFGFSEIDLKLDNSSENIESTSFYILDEKQNPEKIYFLIRGNIGFLESDSFTNYKNINLYLENSSQTTFIKDKYNLTIPTDFTKTNTSYNLNKEFEFHGKKSKLDSISISPLDILIKLSSRENGLEEFGDLSFEGKLPIKLVFKDGFTISQPDNSGGSNSGEDFYAYYSFINHNLSNKDLDYIMISNEKIYLDK